MVQVYRASDGAAVVGGQGKAELQLDGLEDVERHVPDVVFTLLEARQEYVKAKTRKNWRVLQAVGVQLLRWQNLNYIST